MVFGMVKRKTHHLAGIIGVVSLKAYVITVVFWTRYSHGIFARSAAWNSGELMLM